MYLLDVGKQLTHLKLDKANVKTINEMHAEKKVLSN